MLSSIQNSPCQLTELQEEVEKSQIGFQFGIRDSLDVVSEGEEDGL